MKSISEISRTIGRPCSTVQSVIDRFCINKTVRNRPRSGRLQSLRERVKAVIVRSIKKNPKANAPQIRNALESRGVYVRTDTVKNALKRHGYNDRVARKNSTSMNGTVRST